MRNRLKFSRLTDQLITMEGIDFRRELIENFIEVSKSFERFPQETLVDIDNLVENIKKVDPEKGGNYSWIYWMPINLHDGVGKEIELHSFHKKCENIRKA